MFFANGYKVNKFDKYIDFALQKSKILNIDFKQPAPTVSAIFLLN